MLRFSGAGVSDVGRVRPHNEDSGFVGPYVALVADGVGGAAAGEVASATAAYSASRGRARPLGQPPEQVLGTRPRRGHARGPDGRAARPRAARHGDHADHAGHRRPARRARPRRRLARLPAAADGDADARSPRDHTYVQHLVDDGSARPRRRPSHPWRNVVLRSVDGDPEGGGLDVVRLDVALGDRLLLCSDGLTDLVDDGRIAAGAREPQEQRRGRGARSPSWR